MDPSDDPGLAVPAWPLRSLEFYEDALRHAGQFVTVQRRAILRYLIQHPTHPTAAEIGDAVVGGARTASVATIYNNLALFAQLGLLRCVRFPDGEAHWDMRTEPHHHLRCIQCGGVEDIDRAAAEVQIRDPHLRDRVRHSEVWLAGTCSRCDVPAGS